MSEWALMSIVGSVCKSAERIAGVCTGNPVQVVRQQVNIGKKEAIILGSILGGTAIVCTVAGIIATKKFKNDNRKLTIKVGDSQVQVGSEEKNEEVCK